MLEIIFYILFFPMAILLAVIFIVSAKDGIADFFGKKVVSKEKFYKIKSLEELKRQIEGEKQELELERAGIEKAREDFSQQWEEIREEKEKEQEALQLVAAEQNMEAERLKKEAERTLQEAQNELKRAKQERIAGERANKELAERIFELQCYHDEMIDARDSYNLRIFELDNESFEKRNHEKLKPVSREKYNVNTIYNERLWNINSLFFSIEMEEKYKEAFVDSITRKAVKEHFYFKNLQVNTNKVPFSVLADVLSFKNNGEIHEYKEISLVRCTCPYYEKNHKVCKHMMALAMKVGAITVDVDEVLNRE